MKYKIYTNDDMIFESECEEIVYFEDMMYFGDFVINKNSFAYAEPIIKDKSTQSEKIYINDIYIHEIAQKMSKMAMPRLKDGSF